MKKKQLLTKMLLAVAMLGAGATSVWATEVNATLVHTSSTWCGAKVADEAGEGANLYVKNAGGYVYAQGSVDGATEHYHNEGSGTYQGYAFAEFSFAIPDGESIVSATLTWKSTTSASGTRNHTIYVLNAGTTLNYETIAAGGTLLRYNGSKSSAVYSESWNNTATKETDVTDIVKTIAASQNYIIFQWTNNGGGGDLVGKSAASDAPTLTITTQNASTVTSYTVNYVLASDDTVLKEATVHEGATIGESATATAEEMASFKNNAGTKKYIYVSESSTASIASLSATAAENQITLKFREAETWSYTVKTSTGVTLVTGSNFEQESITVSYNGFYLNGTDLYAVDKYDDSKRRYQATFTLDSDNKEVSITASKSKENIVFYTEGENVDGMSSCGGSNVKIRCSGAAAGTTSTSSPVTITKLAPGEYKIYAGLYDNSNSTHHTATFTVGSNTLTFATTGVNVTVPASDPEKFTINQYTDVVYNGTASTNNGLDYVYIQKTGDPTYISATIGSNGYASFSSTYPVDFTDVTDATAYIATDKNDDYIKMQSVTGTVAAGTGLVLKSTNGGAVNINIPVAASGSYYNTNTDPKNYLFAIDSDYDLEAATGGAVNYVLSVQTINEVETVVWAPIGTTPASVTAGHAGLWLPAEVTAQARGLRMVFDGESTGIESLDNMTISPVDRSVYDLQGRKWSNGQMPKGLYIVDGKKVVVK